MGLPKDRMPNCRISNVFMWMYQRFSNGYDLSIKVIFSIKFIIFFIKYIMHQKNLFQLKRLHVVKKTSHRLNLKHRNINLAICANLLFGLFWPSLPLFGWSEYVVEPSRVSCGLATMNNEKYISTLSYNFASLIFIYVIPLTIIIYANIRIKLEVSLIPT